MITVFGRRWRLCALWYGEAAAAAAALWALMHGGGWRAALTTLLYLLVCGAALTVPGQALRAFATAVHAGPRSRRLLLHALFVFSAAASAAALSTANVPAAVVFLLLLGNALWALELESRTRQRRGGQPQVEEGNAAAPAAAERQAGK
jgi:hypothetical protein